MRGSRAQSPEFPVIFCNSIVLSKGSLPLSPFPPSPPFHLSYFKYLLSISNITDPVPDAGDGDRKEEKFIALNGPPYLDSEANTEQHGWTMIQGGSGNLVCMLLNFKVRVKFPH